MAFEFGSVLVEALDEEGGEADDLDVEVFDEDVILNGIRDVGFRRSPEIEENRACFMLLPRFARRIHFIPEIRFGSIRVQNMRSSLCDHDTAQDFV